MTAFIFAVLSVCTLSWTVTQEEIFKELREWCSARRQTCSSAVMRKLLYLPTCHYCLSFWFSLIVITIYGLPTIWFLPVIWISNVVMTAYGLLRQQQKKCSLEAKHHERRLAA